ncbi:MAG: M6 family metalloprotease domain-containing protein [Chitinispirillaceae bacterium]|nr:M6 family metalloprotease domain-containing protein [Chitinispirillaceae bacterium]
MKRIHCSALRFVFPIITNLVLYLAAAPHNGDLFELSQPDGSTVPVLVWGDEFYQRVETPDGYTLVRNKETGWICYAELAPDSSELIPTDRIYQPGKGLSKSLNTPGTPEKELPQHLKLRRSSRLRKHTEIRQRLLGSDDEAGGPTLLPSPPSTGDDSPSILPLQGVKPIVGSFTGLTVVIDFSDQQATVPIDSIRDFTNKRDYTGFRNNGSVRDFYFDVSGGKVDYQNTVVGYYRAKNAKSYYDSRSASFGTRAQELILEALQWLKNDGFDFSTLSTYTSSSDATRKKIRAINILYAGSPSQGWSEGLWPHMSRLSIRESYNGVYIDKYQISNIGSSLKLGTFCHENGHMLFNWPDLYDYGGESGGVGVYCLMCNTGTTNPIPPCAYLRDLAGWDAVTDITDLAQGTVLTQLPANISTTFMFRNKSNANEMFYIEARRRIGRFKTLPDSGFMIWHVDRNGSNDDEQGTATRHYLVSLEQADNAFQLEKSINSGKAGDLFRKGYKDRFSDTTKPDAHWWSGSNSGMKIFNMSGVADTMSFSIGEIGGTTHTIIASAGEHGSINPSGKISAVAGSSLNFAVKPDSGYQIDAITIDGASAALVDTVHLENISGDHNISVVFGIKGALGIISPQKGDVFYAGDTTSIKWRTRGVTVEGIDVSYSIDGGKSFTVIKSGISSADSVLLWAVPLVQSDSCMIKVADIDGNPAASSGMFFIKKKPSIAVAAAQITLTVEQGKSVQQTFSIENKGTGDLRVTATTTRQIDKVLINEIAVGSSPVPDAIELFNTGVDIDLSGWQLLWDDNNSTSGSYTFPKGFIFKGGTAFLITDDMSDTGAVSAYIGLNVQWLISNTFILAVTLLDATGLGVDFVKSTSSPVVAPEGTQWRGNGVELSKAYIARVGFNDQDSASDWVCTDEGSLKRNNATQQVSTVPPLMAATPLAAAVAGGGTAALTLTLDATAMEAGSYTDTLVIYHNDPAKPSPLRIPCTIGVVAPSKVFARRASDERQPIPGTLIAAPNPVPPGERVFFQYQPEGDERGGELVIYNSVGDCLYSDEIDFSRVTVFNKQPLLFSWLPVSNSGKAYRRGTCLVRLTVRKTDGSRVLFSTKVGLQ